MPIAAADLNGDGKADVVGVFNNTLLVYIGKGAGTFATAVSYTLGGSPLETPGVSLADVNGDHILDIAVTLTLPPHRNSFFCVMEMGRFRRAKPRL